MFYDFLSIIKEYHTNKKKINIINKKINQNKLKFL